MAIYMLRGAAYAKDLVRKDKHLIDWLEYIHKRNKDTIIDYEDAQDYKKRDAFAFYASGFYNKDNPQKPKTPDLVPRKVTKDAPPVRDYVVIDYDEFTDKEKADTLPDRVHELFEDYDYACYPSLRYPTLPRWRVVLMINQFIGQKEYKEVVQTIIDKIGFPDGDDGNLEITHLMNAPAYTSSESPQKAVFNKTGNAYDISDILDDMSETQIEVSNSDDKPKKDISTQINSDALETALNSFISNPDILDQLENNYNYFWRLTESVAMAQLSGTITEEFAEQVMTKIAVGNPDWEKNNIQELRNQKEKLEKDASKQQLVQPITSYLPIVAQYQGINNLAQLLDSMMPDRFQPDPQIRPDEVAKTIMRFFEFALLPTRGQADADNVAIFNPLTGAWEHDEDQFIAMMTVIKPGVTANQVRTIMMQWGAIARRKDAVISPYDKTRFLLFKNGALDIKTMRLHDFNDPVIRESEFTKRHKINLNWNANPSLKIFKDDRPDDGDWSIDQFIGGYSYNKPELTEYFLFGLALGLFAGHNTSVHFDIQGKSRLGKTTLSAIYDNLFSGRIAVTTYNQLNQPFPLTSYDPDTAIIWVKECNIGAMPLNDEFGTPFYDGLADNQMRLPVKHGGDMIVDNPPQLFVDGTQFIQATEIHTGPAGRTLAFKLPDVTEEERDQFYSRDIFSKFKDEEVMQYLVYRMIEAFKNVVPENRWENFKMNLSSKRDLALLPKEAADWRHEFVNSDINIKTWFDDEVLPFLIVNGKKPLHVQVLHKMYLSNVRRKSKSGNDDRYAQGLDRFEKNVIPLFHENGYELDYTSGASIDQRRPNARPRRKVTGPDKVGIDWDEYEESYVRPQELEREQNMPDLFGKKTIGWFNVITK